MKTPSIILYWIKHPSNSSGYNPKKNKNTLSMGYWIEHAGSLWAGESSRQNTIEELLKLGEEMNWENTEIYSAHKNYFWQKELRGAMKGIYCFHGNMQKLSNAFRVWIWSPKIIKLIKNSIL